MNKVLMHKPDSLSLKDPIVNCGVYDPQKDEFPITDGSGLDKSIKANDAFILKKNMTISDNAIHQHTILVAKVNNPTQNINDWILIEPDSSIKRVAIDEYIHPSIFTRFKKFVSNLFNKKQ